MNRKSNTTRQTRQDRFCNLANDDKPPDSKM